jgi:Chaperone of endosialidase
MLLYIVYIYMKSSNKYLLLSAVATTLISSAALVYAWVGPTGNPLVNNVAAPVNVGTITQIKTGDFGLTGNLAVSGSIRNSAALAANSNLAGYNLGVGTIGANTSIYSYGSICTNNGSYDCAGASGVVTGPINTAAQVNFTTGISFFNGGNVGIGTTAPGMKLTINGDNGNGWNSWFGTSGTSNRLTFGVRSGTAAIQGFNNTGASVANINLQSDGGNVGVGTSTPAAKLAVQGDLLAAGVVRSSTGGFQFPDGTTQTTAASAGQWTTTGANISNTNSGNVGIGLTNPVNKLEVLGSIQAIGATSSVGTAAGSFLSYSGTTNYLRGNTYFTGALVDEDNSAYYVNPNVTSIFNDLRSNIFYDNNNTSFYLDPNGASNLSSATVGTIYSSNWFRSQGATGWYNEAYGTGLYSDETGFMRGYGATGLKLYGALSAPSLTTTGTIQSASTVRSTAGGFIFPDNTVQTTAATAVVPGNFIANGTVAQTANANITGGFISGSATTSALTVNGQSVFNAINGQSIIGYTVNNNNYLRGNTLFNGVFYDENNLAYYVDPSSVSAFQDIRPSVMYDRDNTGFYIDMNAASNLSSVTMGTAYSSNWFRSYGATGWYNETYGGGLYMDNTSWLKSYGSKSIWAGTGMLGSDGGLTVGYNGATAPAAGAIILGNVGIGTSAPGTKLDVAGTVQATAFVYTSDRSLKDNVQPLQNSLAKVRALNGYTFNWKTSGTKDIGVIAQEVEQVYPSLVHTNRSTGLKSVEYGNLVAPLIEAVKELAAMLESLAARVLNTETRQTELEKQNELQAEQIAELQKQIKTLQLTK